MNEYEFTTDWLSIHVHLWERWMARIPERKRFLEIGSYEGRSSCWFIEHGFQGGGELTCVDPWIGNGEHAPAGVPIDDKKQRFDRNVEIAKARRLAADGTAVNVLVNQMPSLEWLAQAQRDKKEYFDYIYVDGSHTAKDCLTDCILAWPLLRPGGFMNIDDYIWSDGSIANQSPKWGIDVFTSMWGGELDFVGAGAQVVVRKRVAE